jgi:hypothetical protein
MARIKKLLPLLVVVLLAVIVFALFQLQVWPFAASDDTAAMTVTTQVAGNHPTTSTTAPGGTTATTVVPEAQQYERALTDWFATYWAKADTNALVFKKPTAPTAAEIKRAKDFASAMHASLAAIKGIVPPAEAAQAHASFCVATTAEVKELDRLIRAIQAKNRRDIELAFRYATEAHKLEAAALDGLNPYLTGAVTVLIDKAGFKTFTDAAHGVTFQYSAVWTEVTPKEIRSALNVTDDVFLIADPTGSTFGKVPANSIACGIDSYDAKTDGSSVSAMEKELSELMKSAPEYKLVTAPKAFKLNGLDGADTTFSVAAQGQTLLCRIIYLHSGQVTITFKFWADKRALELDNKVFQHILDTLKVGAAT